MASQFGVTQNNDDPSGPQPFDATSTTMPITQQNTPINNNKVDVQTSSGGGGGGGSGIGGIIGAVGGLLGGLFAEGGLVGDKPNGFAEGGPAQGGDKNQALATGYLVGALHQKKFGGDPKTLGVAAQEIKQMLMPQGQQGMADGGIMQNSLNSMQGQNSADQDLAIQSLMKALGVDQAPQQNNTQQPVPQSANLQSNPAQNSPLLASPQAGATQGNMPPQAQPNRAFSTGGYMQYADGGPPMAPQGPSGPPQGDGKPPLQPGQAFQGDGSVKGPGGPQDDAIPAKLSNGEFVFAQPAVQFYGVDKLMKMNEQGKQGFMQAQQQVQANQQPQGGPPGAPPQGQPPMSPPQGQGMMSPPPGQPQGPPPPPGGMAQGGIMKTKGSGYMGC